MVEQRGFSSSHRQVTVTCLGRKLGANKLSGGRGTTWYRTTKNLGEFGEVCWIPSRYVARLGGASTIHSLALTLAMKSDIRHHT